MTTIILHVSESGESSGRSCFLYHVENSTVEKGERVLRNFSCNELIPATDRGIAITFADKTMPEIEAEYPHWFEENP